MRRSSSLLVVFLLLNLQTAHAQSLADVLSSVQERKQVLEQRKQVESHLVRTYTTNQPQIPDQVLIEWDGLASVEFPTDSDTAELGIDVRIKLLNQAIKELRSLQTDFLNFRKEDLTANAQAGILRPYMMEDFPDPGRAGADNYHQVLRLVAQSVRRLAVLPWPLAGNRRTAYSVNTSPQSIASIGPGALEEVEPGWEFDLYEASTITLPDSVGGANDIYCVSKTEEFYDKLALYSKVPQAANQLDGKVAAIARNNWSQVPATSVNVHAPVSWKPSQNGSCVVILVQEDPSGDYATAGTPEITVQLGWQEDAVSWGWPPFPYPAGCNVREFAWYEETSWEELLGLGGYIPSPSWTQPQLVSNRYLFGIFSPRFTKGLDAAGNAPLLEKSEKASAPTAGDAQPVLHPTPGMLLAIPLGTGLDGATMGYIGLTPGEADKSVIAYSYDRFSQYYSIGNPGPQSWELANRFDYAASLRFIGPAQDFHVVYETSREAAKRGASLPPEIPTEEEITDMGCRFFFRNWDLPRLKQVVSRDFIVNITPQGHYKNEVKIYRRPVGAGAVDRTPGAVAVIPTGVQPIRTLILENPDVLAEPNTEEDPYPATPEKLHITDGNANTVYKIWRTGYPASAQKTPSGTGVVHPDIHFEIKEGETVRYAKTMDFQGIGHVATTTTLDGVTVSTETINDQDWAWYHGMAPSNRSIVRGSQTTTVGNTFAANPTPWPPSSARYAWHPLSSEITTTNEPTTNLTWAASGRLATTVKGNWKTDYTIESGALEAVSQFKENTTWKPYATTWTEWSNNDRTIKTYTAPDGAVSSMTADESNWIELTLGNSSNIGLPGLPHQLTRKDGSGAEWSWSSSSLIVTSGLFSGGNLQSGRIEWTSWNTRGYPEITSTELVANGTPIITSFGVGQQYTTWGALEQWDDAHTGLSNVIDYEPGLTRPASITSPLGLTTAFTNYDVFDHPGQVVSNGITANSTFTGLGVTTHYSGTDVTAGSQTSFNQNVEGTSTTTSGTWGGVAQSKNMQRGASEITINGSHGLLGSGNSTIRKEDGSLSDSTGTTRPFGGVDGTALSVENGLFKSTTALGELAASFQTTWTDAWGRMRKSETTGTAGGTDLTEIIHSPPASSIKRVEIRHPSGKRFIEESEPFAATGSISRSGIDINSNGVLDSGDRYVTTATTIVAAKIKATVTQTGNATALMVRDYDPATGITITSLNGGEDEFTETPNYAAKTSELKHKSNGIEVGTKTIALNQLGQVDSTITSGTGMPSHDINPTFRADGSVSAISVNIGGAVATADIDEEGKLSAMTHPLLGALAVSHTFAGGNENLTIDGTTSSRSLDGSASSLSGAGVMARERETTVVAGNFVDKINPGDPNQPEDPSDGANTSLISNPAGAKVLHQYAAGANPQSTWLAGGLLESVSLGRGGVVNHTYSNDGAKDLTKLDWPAMTSAGFPGESFYAKSTEFTQRDDAGNITAMSDPSGDRALSYEKNRLTETDWLAGDLDPYKVVREYDPQTGLIDAVILERNGASIHEITPSYTGASSELAGMATNGFTAAITRDANSRHVTGFTRGTVTQQWGRGIAGRITSANTNSTVTGAATFAYSNFDTKGRRKTVITNRGSWFYDYRGGDNGDGQLISASNGTLNASFAYNFDGIGRRAEFANNATNALNQFVAIEHPLVPKKLYISADPDARLWVNGTEMTPFDGGWIHQLAHPGATGGWVPWHVKGVVEGAGEAGAFPDAVAEFGGDVFFPPTSETFTFDADGNRESSSLWNYGWDGRNHLVRARSKTWNTAPEGWDVQFEYDTEGRRFKKHVTRYKNGAAVEQKVITFVWDGWDLLYERHEDIHGNFLLDRKYVWGPDIADGAAGGAGGLLLIREKRGQTTSDYYPIYDGTGHVTGITDSTGKLVAEYWYGPFGELIEAKGEMAQLNPWRYATKYFDAETGLYYFGLRYYDPATGQWMNREPLGEDESLNLYIYGNNDPVNKVDVRGLKSKWVTDPKNPVTEMPDGSKVINLVWLVDKWWGDDYLDYSKRDTRAFGANYWDHQLWMKNADGSWGASAGNKMWVDTATILEDEHHFSTHAKIGKVLMASYTVVLAAPAVAVAAPAIAAEGSAASYVYGGHALRTAWANPWVQGTGKTAFVAMAGGTGYGVATDESFRADYVALEMSTPAPGEGTVMGLRGLGIIGSDARAGVAVLWRNFGHVKPNSIAGGIEDVPFAFRGDTRSPSEIFQNGFQPHGASDDLFLHAIDNTSPPSIYVPTSRSPVIAADFATGYGMRSGNLYSVRPSGGIDVNQALGTRSPFPNEFEIAIPGGIVPSNIRGVTPLNSDGSFQGFSILNLNFRY